LTGAQSRRIGFAAQIAEVMMASMATARLPASAETSSIERRLPAPAPAQRAAGDL